ncbi:MAG: PspC domain-containing protein [Patescibacteria group bacterium]
MKKTINISLAGQSFTIEEDAYNNLDIYLKEVRENFADYPEVDEIVSDIEARIAERFNSKIKNRVVDFSDVEELIAIMGQPEDFEEGAKAKKSGKKAKAENGDTASVSNKKLFRNPDDVILAGVCSGIASYIGVDTLWVRLAFFVSIFFGGLGIILYVFFWIFVPMAKTETEKMQMRGESVTLKNLEASIKERVKEFKKKDSSKIVSKVGSVVEAFGRILKKIILVFLKIFGVFITIGASMGILAAVFALINILFNDLFDFVYIFNSSLPLRELIDTNTFTVLAVSGFFTVFAVFMLMILLGVSLISSKNRFTYFSFFTLLSVWIIAISTFVATAMGIAPRIHEMRDQIETIQSVQVDDGKFRICLFCDDQSVVENFD